ARDPRLLAGGRTAREALRTEGPDWRGVRRDGRRYRLAARAGRRVLARGRLRARSAVDRYRPRRHADALREPRAVRVPRGPPGRDLRAFAQRVQSRLVVRDRD